MTLAFGKFELKRNFICGFDVMPDNRKVEANFSELVRCVVSNTHRYAKSSCLF